MKRSKHTYGQRITKDITLKTGKRYPDEENGSYRAGRLSR